MSWGRGDGERVSGDGGREGRWRMGDGEMESKEDGELGKGEDEG